MLLLPSIVLIGLHSLEGSAMCSCVSTNCLHGFFPMFVFCSGELVVHLLQGGRCAISRYEVISCFHPFQYFRWVRLCINTVSSRYVTYSDPENRRGTEIKLSIMLPLVSVELEYHAEWCALKSLNIRVSVVVIR